MLARVDADGVVLRAAAGADATVVARLDRGALVVLGSPPTLSGEDWVGATLLDGRTGWLPTTVALRVLPEVTLSQAEAEVLDRPGSLGTPVRTLKKGARFHVLRTVEEPGGDWVEIRQPSGAGGFLPAKTRTARAVEVSDGGAFGLEARGIERGVLGGIAMMAIAVVWFVVAYKGGLIFYYPPVLFLIGLFAVVRGLWTGNLRGRRDTASGAGSGDASPARWSPWIRRVTLGGVVLVAIAVAFLSRREGEAQPSSLWLANGLDVPVRIDVDGHVARVGPGASVGIGAKAGSRHVVARTEAGATLEELDVKDPADESFALYNVLGAATVVVAEVVYGTSTSLDARRPKEPKVLAGESWSVGRHVEHPFEDAPETIQMARGTEVRRTATLLEGGWRTTVNVLFGRGEKERAAQLATRVALEQGDEASLLLAGYLSAEQDAAAALEFGERAALRYPASVQSHRIVQEALERLGRKDEALARYRAAREADPTSARATYLYARLLPAAEALPVLERAVAEHPADSWLRQSLAWNLFSTRRFEAAVPHFEHVREEDVGAETFPLSLYARALAASGRTPQAQRLVLGRVGPGTWETLVLYGRLARRPDADATLPAALDLVPNLAPRELAHDGARALMAGRCRDAAGFAKHAKAIDDPAVREAARIELLSATDPDAAAEAAIAASPATRAGLDALASLIVSCELVRREREDLAREVFEACVVESAGALRFEGLASPATGAANGNLDFELRAALYAAAARRATEPAERDRLLADAKAHDILRCVVP
ncbi:MAG TPA: hypothetical protein VND21_01375 [Planctomycetota bacterium]|nr:hypothetical protein [Planctomycetota bacterium]